MGMWKGLWEWIKRQGRRYKTKILEWVDEQFDHWIDELVNKFFKWKPEMDSPANRAIVNNFVNYAKDGNNRLVERLYDKIF